MNIKKIAPVIIIVGLIVWAIIDLNNNNSNKETKIGNEAPNFTLTTIDGDQVALSDFKGKIVIINFWASWCPPCVAETPDLVKLYETYKDENVVILGVNLTQSESNVNDVLTFVDKHDVTYPILLDNSGTVSSIYKVKGLPSTYFIDSNGVLIEKVEGPMTYETMETILNRVE